MPRSFEGSPDEDRRGMEGARSRRDIDEAEGPQEALQEDPEGPGKAVAKLVGKPVVRQALSAGCASGLKEAY